MTAAFRARALNEKNEFQGGSYSKAFANFVETPDDVEGLLAYSLYKRTINERRSLGILVSNDQRDPQKHEIEIYKTQAARYLETFGATVIEAERAGIIVEGVQGSTVESTRRLDIISKEIKASTGFWWPGVVVGVVAWLISIAITILIVFAAPDWVTAWVRHLASR